MGSRITLQYFGSHGSIVSSKNLGYFLKDPCELLSSSWSGKYIYSYKGIINPFGDTELDNNYRGLSIDKSEVLRKMPRVIVTSEDILINLARLPFERSIYFAREKLKQIYYESKRELEGNKKELICEMTRAVLKIPREVRFYELKKLLR